jgi:hypothetical protein
MGRRRWTACLAHPAGHVAARKRAGTTSALGQKRKCPGSRGTSVLPSGADIVRLDRRKLLVRLEGCYSCSSEKDSNPEQTAAQVIALALSFSELYQNCEVRSFGEKCRLQPQIAVSSAISSTVIQLEGLSLLGIFGLVD